VPRRGAERRVVVGSHLSGCGLARRVAHRLLDPDGLSFAVVGDPADLTPTRTIPEPRF
jgi:hypothetical protein